MPPAPTPADARRPWRSRPHFWLVLGLGAVLFVLWASAFIGQTTRQAQLNGAIDALQVPADWTLVEENRRSPDFTGLCFTSALDVRECDEVLLRYEPGRLPRSETELTALLPQASWRATWGDCSDPPRSGGGTRTVCSLESFVDGFRVEVSLWLQRRAGGTSTPTVDVRVSGEE